jgi:hypothetical protein
VHVRVGAGGASATAIAAPVRCTVTASSGGCNWVVFSNVPWLNVVGTGVGTGNGSVNYTVNPNHGPARAGTMMVQGGSTITVRRPARPRQPSTM